MIGRRHIKIVFFILFIICAGYIISRTPVQELKITAVTDGTDFNISGISNSYYLKPLTAGETYKAVIKFMAVKNTSDNLFTSHGNGQYIYLGCSELKVEYNFISFGRFLHIKLTMNADQTKLKLEDGTPFDITRYSLRPVLIMEK